MDGYFQSREYEHEQIIESWMLAIVENGGVSRYDDLHIDRIDNQWKSPRFWLPAAFHAQDLAIKIRNKHGLRFTVVVGFSLKGSVKQKGVDFRTRAQFEARLNQTPPSLYLFGLGKEPWTQAIIPGTSTSTQNLVVERIESSRLGKVPSLKDCWYFEFMHGDAEKYCRSVFVGEE